MNGAPQVAMVDTLLLREHNRLAGVMERLNTGWNDERVFQTARNTMIVLFIKIVVEEYIDHVSDRAGSRPCRSFGGMGGALGQTELDHYGVQPAVSLAFAHSGHHYLAESCIPCT